MKKERYKPRYKYIRDERKVDMNQYVNDFNKLPLSLYIGSEYLSIYVRRTGRSDINFE